MLLVRVGTRTYDHCSHEEKAGYLHESVATISSVHDHLGIKALKVCHGVSYLNPKPYKP